MSRDIPNPTGMTAEEFVALSVEDPTTFARMVLAHGKATPPPPRPTEDEATKLTAFRLDMDKRRALEARAAAEKVTLTDLLRRGVDLVLDEPSGQAA